MADRRRCRGRSVGDEFWFTARPAAHRCDPSIRPPPADDACDPKACAQEPGAVVPICLSLSDSFRGFGEGVIPVAGCVDLQCAFAAGPCRLPDCTCCNDGNPGRCRIEGARVLLHTLSIGGSGTRFRLPNPGRCSWAAARPCRTASFQHQRQDDWLAAHSVGLSSGAQAGDALPGMATSRRSPYAEVAVVTAGEPTRIASAEPIGLHVPALEFPRRSV
jgi:hypothetical protein